MDPDDFIPTRASLLARLRDWEDQASWREFFETYGRLIYSVGRKAGLSDVEAQDALQETLLAVARRMPGFSYDPAVDSFKGWLMTVTRWKVADQFRKRNGGLACVGSSGSSGGNDPTGEQALEGVPVSVAHELESIWESEWHAHRLSLALARVKSRVQPAHYEIFHLHVIREQPAAEVARTLGVGVARVYLVRHRVGRILKKALHEVDRDAARRR